MTIIYVMPAERQTLAPGNSLNGRTTGPPGRNPLYFIPMKSGTVYRAVAYWVTNGTLQFVTTEGRHKLVEVDQVDRALFERLNESRQVDFSPGLERTSLNGESRH